MYAVVLRDEGRWFVRARLGGVGLWVGLWVGRGWLLGVLRFARYGRLDFEYLLLCVCTSHINSLNSSPSSISGDILHSS